MKILKIVHKIRSHSFEIPINWFSYLNFYTTNRNGIFIKTNLRRIELENKNFFNYCIKLFNDLPIIARNECDFKKFVKLLNEIL